MPACMKWLHASLSLFVCLAGCPKGPAVDAADPLALMLARIDAAWDARAEGGFGPVELAVDEAQKQFPQTPAVQWRSSRLWVGKGLAEADRQAAVMHYAHARGDALACLDGDGRFRQKRLDGGWKPALAVVVPQRDTCVAWMAWSWVRWLDAMGGDPGALDLVAIDQVVGHLEPAAIVEGELPVLWIRGLLAATRPDTDLKAAEVHLRQALVQRPGEHALRADLIVHVALPLEDDALVRRQLELIPRGGGGSPQTPEARRAIDRVAGLR